MSSNDRVTVIQAAHYGENEQALRADPIIQQMTGTLMAHNSREQVCHDEGSPTMDFMAAANREYQARGGKLLQHIGGPARAIMALVADVLPAYEAMAADSASPVHTAEQIERAKDVLRRWKP